MTDFYLVPPLPRGTVYIIIWKLKLIFISSPSLLQFEVHKVILKAAAPRLAWDQTPPPLSNSPEDVLATVLHFLYTECLPETIQEDTARRVLVVAGKLPGFHRLANLLMLYLHNMDVKNRK